MKLIKSTQKQVFFKKKKAQTERRGLVHYVKSISNCFYHFCKYSINLPTMEVDINPLLNNYIWSEKFISHVNSVVKSVLSTSRVNFIYSMNIYNFINSRFLNK